MHIWSLWASKTENIDKILSNGVLRSHLRQKAARNGISKTWSKIKKPQKRDFLWAPFGRILSIFSSFKAQKLLRGICTHQAQQIDGDKNLFSPISEYNKLLRKNAFNPWSYLFRKLQKKLGFCKNKYAPIRYTFWAKRAGFWKKKPPFTKN